ncbi:MAG: FecR domain-containing protein [Synechococcaceae cyanobacterium SM2_3_2]|nr:FecR domain-containing protein [Synechococcaceae cyanobacterium SM2_3_2]
MHRYRFFWGFWVVGIVGLMGMMGLPAWASPTAEVVDIPEEPVFWAQPPQTEAPAEVGTQVQTGGYLRTASPGKAQVLLSDGMAFRLGGDAVLEITDEELRLTQGQIIAWVNPDSEGSLLRIQTPMATAAIRGTTVFIDLDEQGCRIFSWEGEVEISLQDGSDSVLLQTGEEILVEIGMTQLPSPEPIERAVVQARFEESELLNGFGAEMSTLETIQELLLP